MSNALLGGLAIRRWLPTDHVRSLLDLICVF